MQSMMSGRRTRACLRTLPVRMVRGCCCDAGLCRHACVPFEYCAVPFEYCAVSTRQPLHTISDPALSLLCNAGVPPAGQDVCSALLNHNYRLLHDLYSDMAAVEQ